MYVMQAEGVAEVWHPEGGIYLYDLLHGFVYQIFSAVVYYFET